MECFVALPARQHTAERRRKDLQSMNHVRRPGTLVERGEADRADNRTRHGEGHRHRGPNPLVTELVRLRYFIDTLKAHELARQNRLGHPRGLAQWEGRRRRRDACFVPEHRSDGRTVRLNPEERAAVDVERLADPPQRVAHRIIDAVGG